MNDLMTGSNANTNSTQFPNAGTNAMNLYVGAVNGYDQSQAQYALEAGAQEMSGFGEAWGSVLGLGFMGKFAKWQARQATTTVARWRDPALLRALPNRYASGLRVTRLLAPHPPSVSSCLLYMYPQGSRRGRWLVTPAT